MPEYVPLRKDTHANQGWQEPENHGFTSQIAMVPILAEEIPAAIQVLPLAFYRTKAPNGSIEFELVALLSHVEGRNLFVKPNGDWLFGHVPIIFRGYPFRLLTHPKSGQKLVCIDQDSGLITDADAVGSQPFFQPNGQPSPALARVIDFLTQYEKQRELTQQAVNALAEKGMLAPWNVVSKEASEDIQPIRNIFKFNSAAAKQMDQDSLYFLHQREALPIAFAQLLSEWRIQKFGEQLQKQDAALKESKTSVSLEEIEDLLGGGKQDDILSFD